MKIIVDMMGGDNAPLAVLEGAAQAVKEYGITVVGVGDEALVRKTAQENSIPLDGIELVNCTEVIDMCDEPARAIRQKKDSSIVVGLNMLKDGKGDAFVSAGSTGALHVGASLIVRTLKGIKRPALATMVPAKKQAYLLLDCGANVECRPEMLAAFAVMGSCYVNKVEGRRSPSVALANNGAEESKGTPMLKEAHQLLKTTPGIRFVGNIEPRDVPGGEVDVVVCDGFTGNVILKLTEGVAKNAAGHAETNVPRKPRRQAGLSAAQGQRGRPEAPDGQRGVRRRTLPGGQAAGHQGPRLFQGQGHQERHPSGKDLRGERSVRHHAVCAGRAGCGTEN